MINLCILLFAFSLMYLATIERFKSYAMVVSLQGVLLFIISFSLLDEINFFNLVFIIFETIVFKAIIMPALLFRIIRKTHVTKVHKDSLPTFYSVILTTIALLGSVALVLALDDGVMNSIFFGVAIFGIITGLLMIVTHKRIFSHMVGFLVIENAIFIFSIAVGTEMPMLINVGILLDIFISVLILVIFITRINNTMHNLEMDSLSSLKD